MADHVYVNEGSETPVAADEVGGIKYQIIKLALGPDGSVTLIAPGQQLKAASVPVVLASDQDAVPVTLSAGDENIGNVDLASALPAGDNNIGNVDVETLPALAAGTNLIGKASVAPDTSAIYNGTTALTPKFASISGNTNGNNTLVAAVADKRIRVVALMLMAAGTVTVTLQDGAGGTALTGALALTAQTGFCLPYNPVGWLQTSVNTLLNMSLNAAVQVSGCLVYVEV